MTNAAVTPHIAPLRNVLLMRRMVEQLRGRNPNMPGIGVMHGFAGLGKSNAVAAATAATRGLNVELRDHFTRKLFLAAILAEMGVQPGRTTGEMFLQVAEQLAKGGQPLFIDMADYLVKRKLIDTLLDVYEASKAVIVLSGEERLPVKLEQESERFYDRVLVWQPAEKADTEDTRKLARLYAEGLPFDDDVLEAMAKGENGIARKIVVKIETIRQEAKKTGDRRVTLKWLNDRGITFGSSKPTIRGSR